MTKKKVILLAAAALFAVSGLTALPSGNITGGVGCIVVAAVCAYFGLIELDVIEDATPSVSQHTGETTVYVDRSNKKYHSKPNCSGMKNPKSIPLSQAKKKYTACKKCCK